MTASSERPHDWAELTEAALLDAMLTHAPQLGWSRRTLLRAGKDAGLSEGDVDLLCPNGPQDLAALFSRRCDHGAMAALSMVDPATLKIREKIARGVETWLEACAAHLEAARRWSGYLALPTNAPLGLKLAWETADVIWRWAGDTATDENHYSKRAILSGILIPALALRLHDGKAASDAFTAARIENVMQFEKWKAGIKPSETAQRFVEALSRLRYGSGA